MVGLNILHRLSVRSKGGESHSDSDASESYIQVASVSVCNLLLSPPSSGVLLCLWSVLLQTFGGTCSVWTGWLSLDWTSMHTI